ncbi:alpha/beta fold hydrolase [Streptomyces purpureus]|uniref:Hydrolase n=2 Tax=Streptomyces purpureus TaxID=1951 RepID=A0A918LV05_9ACTN|nr:alpha/beta hydrolase [Streptomyces purpureus]GGT53517.1 hydrolase [Streptomyces purpureus]
MALTSRRLGSGPPLLVVLQLDRDGWRPVLERLSREYEVVAVDLPGFGDSPALPEGTTPTVEALAAAVAEWLPGAGLTRPPVVGNSLGGAVALELARIGAVGSAVALSPIGLWTGPEAAYALGSLRIAHSMARAFVERPGWIAGHPIGRTVAFWQLVARPWRIPEAAAVGALSNLARSPGFEPTRHAAHSYRLRAFAPGVPVTVGWGTRDLMTPPHQALRAARLLPGARHVSLKGCGHSPMSDDPEQITQVVLDAIRG